MTYLEKWRALDNRVEALPDGPLKKILVWAMRGLDEFGDDDEDLDAFAKDLTELEQDLNDGRSV